MDRRIVDEWEEYPSLKLIRFSSFRPMSVSDILCFFLNFVLFCFIFVFLLLLFLTCEPLEVENKRKQDEGRRR